MQLELLPSVLLITAILEEHLNALLDFLRDVNVAEFFQHPESCCDCAY
jgi:hypothetical protein